MISHREVFKVLLAYILILKTDELNTREVIHYTCHYESLLGLSLRYLATAGMSSFSMAVLLQILESDNGSFIHSII